MTRYRVYICAEFDFTIAAMMQTIIQWTKEIENWSNLYSVEYVNGRVNSNEQMKNSR